MRVCVVGLGGVGGYIAANFFRAGIDVVGVARGEHFKALKEDGLRIMEDEKTFTVALPVCEAGFLEGIFDVVLFCTKTYDLKDAAEVMQNHINKNTVAVSFSNGVANAEVLRSCLDAQILDGIVYILAHIEQPGVVRKNGNVFAAVFGGEKSDLFAKLFEKSNLKYKISLDIQKDLWKKYIFISAFATLTSYYDLSIYQIYRQKNEVVRTVLEEIAMVAKYKGIDIKKEVEKSLQTASKLPKDASTSMHKDFLNKKKTELESLTGYLVHEAKESGIELPCIAKMYEELKKR